MLKKTGIFDKLSTVVQYLTKKKPRAKRAYKMSSGLKRFFKILFRHITTIFNLTIKNVLIFY